MQIFYPDYYKQFHCVAEKCPDTCCGQWEIAVDAESLSYYQCCKDSFGKQIQSHIRKKKGISVIDGEKLCPFLNEQQLCGIYKHLGEDHMPTVCRAYPRFFTDYGARRENLLSPSCPEAARLLLSMDKPLSLHSKSDDSPAQPNTIDGRLFYYLLKARQTCLNIVQTPGETVSQRIDRLAEFALRLEKDRRQQNLSPTDAIGTPTVTVTFSIGRARSVLLRTEMMTERWKAVLKSPPVFRALTDREAKNILSYFLLHYFLTAVYDGRILDKIRFAIISLSVIEQLGGAFSDTTDALHLYCREILHSVKNVRLLQKKSGKILTIEPR